MYYLHKIDTPRDTIIVIDTNQESPVTHITINGSPLKYQDGTTVPNKIGWTLGPVETKREAENTARAIATRFNWDIEMDGKLLNLTTDYIRRAAAEMGSIRSDRKAASSSANGKKGGRPRKQQSKLGSGEGSDGPG